MILTGESAVVQFCEHYHHEWNHLGLENKFIDPKFSAQCVGEIHFRKRPGGLLCYYN